MNVETLRTRAAWAIDKVVRGQTITVYKWQEPVAPAAGSREELYRTQQHTYDDGTALVAHIVTELRDEQRSDHGLSAQTTGMVTASYLHIKDAFPDVEPTDAIVLADEIGFDGVRYRITELHHTGRGEHSPVVYIIGFAAKTGNERAVG